MKALPYDDVSYCMYGFRYQKTTRIWNNLPWVPSQPVCSKRGRCEAFQDGRHPETAQRQGSRHWPGQTREQLYSLPPRLCREIAESLNGKGEALPHRRIHLETATRPDRPPCTGIFLGPSKSGKTAALISAILDQYMTGGGESVFERIYIFSPSIEIDDAWKPVKGFIEQHMGVNTEREQVYFDKWDEGALRTIIQQQKKITRTTKELGFKKLYLIACWCKTTKREKWFVPNKGHYDVRHVLTSLQQRKRAPSLFASQGGNDVLSRSFESLQPKLHGSAGARRRTTSTQCFEDRIERFFKQSDHPGHSCSPQHDSSPGGWVGEKFSLNHSTDEPKASAGELQPSW